MITPEEKLYYIAYWIPKRANGRLYAYSENTLTRYFSDKYQAWDFAVDLEAENKIPANWEIVSTVRRNISTDEFVD